MDPNRTWQQILDVVKNQISSGNFKTWFSQTALNSITPEQISIYIPSAFIQSQLVSRYDPLIRDAINTVLGKDLQIEYVIDPSKFLKTVKESSEEEEIFQIPATQAPNITLLNPKYTIENFVVGPTNNLAYAAAQAVVQNPGTSYNPLFIYGPSGVGKTHLMQAIGNALIAKNPSAKLVFASSERFTVDLVDSIQNKRTGDFRAKYRSCDILLIDDIQFIAGKDSTQEEFFHTFNELHSKSAQIVLNSDRPPQEMQKLESRLMSRFQGGLMVDIQLPDFETRLAIIQAKLKERGDNLPEEIINTIAENTASNTRELEGKLIQILQMAKLSGQPLTPEFVQQLLGKPQQSNGQGLDHKKVLGEIHQYFNVKASDLTGPRRQRILVLPRQIAMYLMYEECKMPMEKIGQVLGGRDHTTVLHGIEKIKDVIQRDREIQRMIIELKQHLGA